MEVHDDHVTVLADIAERAEEIDRPRAEAARDRAEQRLRDIHAHDIDFERARGSARGRMSAAGGRTSGCVVSFPLPPGGVRMRGPGCTPAPPNTWHLTDTRQPTATVLPLRLADFVPAPAPPDDLVALAVGWWRSSWHVVSRACAVLAWSSSALWLCSLQQNVVCVAWSTV